MKNPTIREKIKALSLQIQEQNQIAIDFSLDQETRNEATRKGTELLKQLNKLLDEALKGL